MVDRPTNTIRLEVFYYERRSWVPNILMALSACTSQRVAREQEQLRPIPNKYLLLFDKKRIKGKYRAITGKNLYCSVKNTFNHNCKYGHVKITFDTMVWGLEFSQRLLLFVTCESTIQGIWPILYHRLIVCWIIVHEVQRMSLDSWAWLPCSR